MKVSFVEIFEDVTKYGAKISKDSYLKKGKYPIIDQGQNYIAGYSNEKNGVFTDVPAIIFGDHTRIIKYIDFPCFLGADGVKLLKTKNNIWNYKYLYYSLCYSEIPNTGYNRHYKYLKEISINYYGIDEQTLIANKLDKINHLIDIKKTELIYFEQIVKSRFIEMFGDSDKNEKGYIIKKLETLANKISDGVHSKPIYTETGKPFISVVNINRGIINFDKCKFVSEADYQKMIKSTHPEMGDVLYTKVGATYGIPAYVDTNKAFCLYVSVCLIKPKSEKINGKFLALSMRMPYVKRQADSRIKGIGVPNLHLNQIKKFDILCPPIKEQEFYVAFSEQVDKSKFECSISLNLLESFNYYNHFQA